MLILISAALTSVGTYISQSYEASSKEYSVFPKVSQHVPSAVEQTTLSLQA